MGKELEQTALQGDIQMANKRINRCSQWGVEGVKGVKYMVTENDKTWMAGRQCDMKILYRRNVRLKPI